MLLQKPLAGGWWAAIGWEHCHAMLFLLGSSHASVAPVLTDTDR